MAVFPIGGLSGQSLTAVARRNSDGWFWREDTEVWQAGVYSNSPSYNTNMKAWLWEETHADFTGTASVVSIIQSGAPAALVTFIYAGSEGTVTTIVEHGYNILEAGVS